MYVDMRTRTCPCSPGINVAIHKSQSCCISWCSCFAECGSKPTLMSAGAGRCAQGPLHCRWMYTCLCIACGSQSSTSHAGCRTARASLHLLKRSFGLHCDADPFLGLGLHAFCLPSLRTLHVKPASWHQAQENMNERCNLSQLNALFTEGKTHIPWAQNWGHKFGSWATNFNRPIFGSRIWPLFWDHKIQTGAIQYGASVLLPPQADSGTYPWYCVYIYMHIWVN